MKYDMFVFAGQSNMMGACALPPKHGLKIKKSLEYKYKPVHIGTGRGVFSPVGYDSGEFLYKDVSLAYSKADEKGQSLLKDYQNNAYFVSALSNLKDEKEKSVLPFSEYSESERKKACSIVPYFCEEWEKEGGAALVAHIAQGGAPIGHFFSKEMMKEYNGFAKKNGFSELSGDGEAEAVYVKKCTAFFYDAEKAFGADSLGEKVLVWNQGESDLADSIKEYEEKLRIFWKKAKSVGFDKLFIIRCSFWGTRKTANVMAAQERFAAANDDTFIITRALSLMPDPGFMPHIEEFYTEKPEEDYYYCRDSYSGYNNPHINEKGFIIAAKAAARNAFRVLKEHKAPNLERDTVRY